MVIIGLTAEANINTLRLVCTHKLGCFDHIQLKIDIQARGTEGWPAFVVLLYANMNSEQHEQ